MKSINYLLAVAFFAVIAIPKSQAQNQLRNGDFKQGGLHWQNLAQNSAAANYSYQHIANTTDTVLQAVVSALGGNSWDAQTLHDDVLCTAGKQYVLKARVRSLTGTANIRLVMQDTTFSAQDVTASTSFNDVSWTFTAQETGLGFKIHWYQRGTFQITNISLEEANPTPIPIYADSLKHYANLLNLNLGAALEPRLLGADAAYSKIYNQQFNALVAENAMKMEAIAPARGVYNFFEADSLMRYARRTGKKVRGHTLLWHNSIPSWLRQGNYAADTLFQILKDYTLTVVGRYRSQITEWDVVNEALADQAPNNLRTQYPYNVLGLAILDSMFVWAHAADPQARLFYNDYSIEYPNPKANSMLTLVNGLKQRGRPIHGVGFQCHFNYDVPANFFPAVESIVTRVGNLGLQVSFTEVDFAIPTPIAASNYITQGHAYAELLRVALRNSSTVGTFMLWGLTDKYSWIPSFWASQGTPKDDALILTRTYAPKPAYDSLLASLQGRVITKLPESQPTKFSIYPNPARDCLYVSSTTDLGSVRLYNARGESLIPRIGSTNTLDISHLSAGLYILHYKSRVVHFIKE